MNDLPNIAPDSLQVPTAEDLVPAERSTHPPRILLLYGSLRERSFSRLVVEESKRLLQAMGRGERGVELPPWGHRQRSYLSGILPNSSPTVKTTDNHSN